MSISTIRHYLNQVCMRGTRGARPKGEELGEEMRHFWKQKFPSFYPDKVSMQRMSMLNQIVAQQMLDNILVDPNTHFEKKTPQDDAIPCKTRCKVSGIGKKALWGRAMKICNAVIHGDLESIPEEIRDEFRTIMPREEEK